MLAVLWVILREIWQLQLCRHSILIMGRNRSIPSPCPLLILSLLESRSHTHTYTHTRSCRSKWVTAVHVSSSCLRTEKQPLDLNCCQDDTCTVRRWKMAVRKASKYTFFYLLLIWRCLTWKNINTKKRSSQCVYLTSPPRLTNLPIRWVCGV